jgi:hypothetical protein
LYSNQSLLGLWPDAEQTWKLIEGKHGEQRRIYRNGDAESDFARSQYWQGTLKEQHLIDAERLVRDGRNRSSIRALHWLRGEWELANENWKAARESFQTAIAMAREKCIQDAESETCLVLAKWKLKGLSIGEVRAELTRLEAFRQPAHRRLAMLMFAVGEDSRAKEHAVAAYKWAWASGEPYVRRYELNQTIELLKQLKTPVPTLPQYDPTRDIQIPHEGAIRSAIEKLRGRTRDTSR